MAKNLIESVPAVSVLMAVYNGEKYVRPAIDGILGQTFIDFEFIVVDDGSTDDTPLILKEYDDHRLNVIHQANMGLTPTLNRIIDLAKGKYLAIQDADDISTKDRLATQVEFLDRNPEVALVGTWGEQIDAAGESLGILRRLANHTDIKENLINENEFLHGSIMIRSEVMKKIGKYRSHFQFSQDYDLVLRLVHTNNLANIPMPLYKKRHVQETVSVRNIKKQKHFSKLAQELYKERLTSGKDSLDRGAPIDELVELDEDELSGSIYYEENTIYLYFRSDNYEKARTEIKKVIMKRPLRLKSYVQYLVTFLSPRIVNKIINLRDRSHTH